MKAKNVGKCPICDKCEFTMLNDICDVCKWFHDSVQENNPDEENCANKMSFN